MKNCFKTFMAVAGLAAALGLSAQGASAQSSMAQGQQGNPDLDIEIGLAAGFTPSYEGSPSLQATGFPFFTMNFIRLPIFGGIGGPERGLSFAPSFRFVSARKQSDDRRLFGLGNIDAAVELGGKISYRWQNARVFATARKGFGGHTGWTGEIGADLIVNPAPMWIVEAGPRVQFASASYMSKYFGVTATQALASGYPLYAARGGVKGVGAEAKITRRLNEKWSIVGRASFIRLTGDAGNAPLVRAGTPNMFSASLGLSYRFVTSFSGNR